MPRSYQVRQENTRHEAKGNETRDSAGSHGNLLDAHILILMLILILTLILTLMLIVIPKLILILMLIPMLVLILMMTLILMPILMLMLMLAPDGPKSSRLEGLTFFGEKVTRMISLPRLASRVLLPSRCHNVPRDTPTR